LIPNNVGSTCSNSSPNVAILLTLIGIVPITSSAKVTSGYETPIKNIKINIDETI
jgi:hypothetical protein